MDVPDPASDAPGSTAGGGTVGGGTAGGAVTGASSARSEPQEGRGRLTVQIVGGAGEPERLMLLYREGAEGGRLYVKEWSSTGGDVPREYEVDPEDLYASLREAVRRGRRVTQELYRVRLWLDGVDV